jgi:hypothetical protein
MLLPSKRKLWDFTAKEFAVLKYAFPSIYTYICILVLNRLTLQLNPSAQSCLPRFFTVRPLYKSFGVKELIYYKL